LYFPGTTIRRDFIAENHFLRFYSHIIGNGGGMITTGYMTSCQNYTCKANSNQQGAHVCLDSEYIYQLENFRHAIVVRHKKESKKAYLILFRQVKKSSKKRYEKNGAVRLLHFIVILF
jgi:hypothetical protein